MRSVNLVILIGHVGADPETRRTAGGTAVATFSVATSESWEANGEKKERTTWHRCVAWKRLAEVVGEYVRKGDPVYLQGKVQSNEWTDRDGNKRTTQEVVIDRLNMLGGRKNGGTARPQEDREPDRGGSDLPDDGLGDRGADDDDLPF